MGWRCCTLGSKAEPQRSRDGVGGFLGNETGQEKTLDDPVGKFTDCG